MKNNNVYNWALFTKNVNAFSIRAHLKQDDGKLASKKKII
jgi:hypothetical protein